MRIWNVSQSKMIPVNKYYDHGFKQGPCQGDSGAPLLTQTTLESGERKDITIVGVHSGAASCGNKRKKDLPAWWIRVCNIYN